MGWANPRCARSRARRTGLAARVPGGARGLRPARASALRVTPGFATKLRERNLRLAWVLQKVCSYNRLYLGLTARNPPSPSAPPQRQGPHGPRRTTTPTPAGRFRSPWAPPGAMSNPRPAFGPAMCPPEPGVVHRRPYAATVVPRAALRGRHSHCIRCAKLNSRNFIVVIRQFPSHRSQSDTVILVSCAAAKARLCERGRNPHGQHPVRACRGFAIKKP